MGVRADADLHASLDRVIAELNKTADKGIDFTPEMIRFVTKTLGVIRDCHRSLADLELRMRGRIEAELFPAPEPKKLPAPLKVVE